MRLIDHLFEMGGGYVLDFTDRTFGEFFKHDLQINIDDPRFSINGSSKAKRLRCFLQTVQEPTAIRALLGLWEYRNAIRRRRREGDPTPDEEQEFGDLIESLGGQRPKSAAKPAQPPTASNQASPAVLKALATEFVAISQKPSQERGYAFEKWLKAMFDAYGLAGRGSFRLVGEQIDGSMELVGETYLAEARWRNAPAGAGDLHAFHGKLEEKAQWTRGLFISMAGFTPDGLTAFGKGKRLICMDGLDLHEMLDRGLSLHEVLTRKARRAAETGSPFASVRNLFD